MVMKRFRTLSRFARALIALFLVAQFAGIVSSPIARAQGISSTHSHVRHHFGDKRNKGTFHHHDGERSNDVDPCCALHAFFVGVLPPAIVLEAMNVIGQRLSADLDDIDAGIPSARLDRPPRPLFVI
jgi:hypothetical protein